MMGQAAVWFDVIGYGLDTAALLASAFAAWLWYQASCITIHRVTIDEVFDYHDLNRVIVAINRNSIRNRRAALASTIAVLVLSLDLLIARLFG